MTRRSIIACIISLIFMPQIFIASAIAAPSNLTATPSSGNVLLTWSDSSPNVQYYSIYRGVTPGGPYTASTKTYPAYFRDSYGTIGQTYYYVVKTRYKDGTTSPYSNEVSAAANPYASDIFEPDSSYLLARPITKDGTPQEHNYDTSIDEDWLSFSLATDEVVEIKTDKLGVQADTVVNLFDHTGLLMLVEDDDSGGYNFASKIVFKAASSDNYLLQIKDRFDAFGRATSYQVSVTSSINDISNPIVKSLSPFDGSMIGTSTLLTAEARDDVAISDVTFQYKLASDNAWATIDTVTAETADQIKFTLYWTNSLSDTDLVNIRAIAKDTNGYLSNGLPEYSYTVDKSAPLSPINLVKEADGSALTLNWQAEPVTSNDVSGFNVYRSASLNGSYDKTASTLVSSYTTRLLASADYFKITAVDVVGNESPAATIDSIFPDAPVLTSLTQEGSSSIRVAWSASDPNISYFEIYRSSDLEASTEPSLASWSLIGQTASQDFLDQNVPPSSRTFYRMRGIDQSGRPGLYSNVLNSTLTDIDDPQIINFTPSNFSSVSGDTLLTIRSNEPLQSAIFEYSADNGLTWSSIGISTYTSSTDWQAYWDTTGLISGIYDVRAIATDLAGNTSDGMPHMSYYFEKAPMIANYYAEPLVFSPNGDGNLEKTQINYSLTKNATVDINIYDTDNILRKNLLAATSEAAGSYQLFWDGRDDGGSVLPTGTYFYVVNAADNLGSEEAEGIVKIETQPVQLLVIASGDNSVGLLASSSKKYPFDKVTFKYRQSPDSSWQSIWTDISSADGWMMSWDTTRIPGGSYEVMAVGHFCGLHGYCYLDHSQSEQVSVNNQDIYEEDGSFEAANDIYLDASQNHLINPSTDSDYLIFQATADQSYRIEIMSSIDVSVDLYSPDRTFLASSDNSSFSGNNVIEFRARETGTFYLKVNGGVGGLVAGYDIKLTGLAQGSISGRVIDPTASPISNVLVQAYSNNSTILRKSVKTNEQGSYDLLGLDATQYTLLFNGDNNSLTYQLDWYDHKSTYSTATPVVVAAGEVTLPNYTVSCLQTPCYASVFGKVRDSFGTPISYADVFLYAASDGSLWRKTSTDVEGNYLLYSVPPSSVVLQYRKGGDFSEYYQHKDSFASADRVTTFSSQGTRINPILLKKGSITGQLTDEFGYPARNVTVNAYKAGSSTIFASATTDAAGSYFLSAIPQGEYRIYFDAGTSSDEVFSQYFQAKQTLASSDLISVINGLETEVSDDLLDISPPVTIINTEPASADGENGYFWTDPSINLTLVEPGVTFYKWDNDPVYIQVSGAIIAMEGNHTIYFYSVDSYGNTESVRSVNISVDSSSPSVPVPVSASHALNSYSSDDTIDINWTPATDETSGIDGYSFIFDQSASSVPGEVKNAEENVTSTVSSPLAEGIWYFHIRSKDNAGNWGSPSHLGPFLIDKTAPSTTLLTGPSGVIATSDVVFTWTGADDHTSSSDLLFSYKLSGIDPDWSLFDTASSRSYQSLPEGNYSFQVRAKDFAGNIDQTPITQSFSIDLPITTRYEESNAGITYSGNCWNNYNNAGLSGGTSKRASKAACTASLTFNGRQVSFISAKASNLGKVAFYVDNVYQTTVDLYSNSAQYQQAVFSASDTQNGTHTIRAEVTHTKNPASSSYYVILDAIDVVN